MNMYVRDRLKKIDTSVPGMITIKTGTLDDCADDCVAAAGSCSGFNYKSGAAGCELLSFASGMHGYKLSELKVHVNYDPQMLEPPEPKFLPLCAGR
jgi:hypothetical protein